MVSFMVFSYRNKSLLIASCLPCRGMSTHNFRPDFMRFNHRGKALPAVLPVDHPVTKTGGI